VTQGGPSATRYLTLPVSSASTDSFALFLFDLRALRAELAELDLDWHAPPYPPAAAPAQAAPPPIDVVTGDLPHWIEADSFINQARQDENAKDYAKAAADLRKALAVAPDYPEANNDLAWLLLTGPKELRDPKAALPLARKAVEEAPVQSLYLNTLGVALYRNDRYAEAVPLLEKSLKASAGATDAFDLFFLAMCRHRLGDAGRAKEDYDRAVRWVADHKATLPAKWSDELTAFQSEADAVLAGPQGAADK
jgi:tetratricopeptide (TPR) repeat protein